MQPVLKYVSLCNFTVWADYLSFIAVIFVFWISFSAIEASKNVKIFLHQPQPSWKWGGLWSPVWQFWQFLENFHNFLLTLVTSLGNTATNMFVILTKVIKAHVNLFSNFHGNYWTFRASSEMDYISCCIPTSINVHRFSKLTYLVTGCQLKQESCFQISKF